MDWRQWAELERVDWNAVGQALVAFAIYRVRTRRWFLGDREAHVALGHSPEDLAAEAIADLLSGRRQWNRERYPDLLDFLKGVVNSKISNLTRSAPARAETRLPDGMEEIGSSAAAPPGYGERQQRVEALVRAVAGAPELAAVVTALEAGAGHEPRRLAEHLGIPVSEVNNRLKRLRRCAFRVQRELSGEVRT